MIEIIFAAVVLAAYSLAAYLSKIPRPTFWDVSIFLWVLMTYAKVYMLAMNQ